MTIAMVFSSVFAIVGCSCSNPDDEFPSAYNAEFEEYSAKVISIMDKIGILDAAIIGVETENEGATARLLSNAYPNNRSAIWDILENVQDVEVRDLYYTFQDAFEQTYFIPLIVGRAISQYYGEANFYDVKVNTPWNQYVETIKNGNTTTTSVYTPAGEVFEKETFIVMNMNYISLENYTLSFVLFNIDESRLYYFNLDHQGNLIAYSYNSDGEEYNNFVLYSNDGFDGYEITDMTICNSVKALLIDEFRSANKDSIRNIKNNVKHNIDSTKWDWASGYFFGGSDDGHIVDYYSYLDSENSTLASIGSDGSKTTLTIPRNVRYISSFFVVGNAQTDGSSDIITLVIPETVRGIKKWNQDNTEIVDASIDELVIVTHDGKTLANIQVAEESPLFMAGEGDLKDLESNVIYHMNKPVTGGVLDITNMAKKFAADPSRAIERDYANKDLYVGSVHTLNLDIELSVPGYDLRMISSLFPNLRTLNITGTGSENQRVDLLFSTRDITINYDVIGKVDVITSFQSMPANHKLNILNDDARIDYYDDTNTVRATVPWSKEYHQLIANEAPLWRIPIENITFGVDPYIDMLSKVTYNKFDDWLRIQINANNASSITIPESYFGMHFKEVEITASNTNFYVSIPSTTTSLTLTNVMESTNYGMNMTIEYNGTFQEFKNILVVDTYDTFRINLISNDFEGEYSYNLSKVTINTVEGSDISYEYASPVENGYNMRIYNIYVPNDVDMSKYYYFYTDQDGNIYAVEAEHYYYIDIEMSELKDLVLTFHQELKTMNFSIVINGDAVYSDVRGIEEIFAGEFTENDVREIRFYTLGGSGSPIFRYTIDNNATFSWGVKQQGNDYIISVVIE